MGYVELSEGKATSMRMVCFVDRSMSTSYIVLDDDDDNHSLSPSKNSDDDVDSCTSAHHTHRSCSRYASCNKTKHKFLSTDSTFAPRSMTSGGPRRGDLRTVANEPGHQQKYDGTKWRRICCIPNCLRCLNRGVYFQNWLCRKHYRSTLTIDLSSDSDSSVVVEQNPRSLRRKAVSKPSTRSSSKKKVGYDNASMRFRFSSDMYPIVFLTQTSATRGYHGASRWDPSKVWRPILAAGVQGYPLQMPCHCSRLLSASRHSYPTEEFKL